MKYCLLFFLILLTLTTISIKHPSMSYAINEPTKCQGEVLQLGFPKKLLTPHALSRPGHCGVMPTKIIIHTTWGVETAEDQFNYFENKPEGRYASTQFVVGKTGDTLQMVETLKDKVEITHAVSNYNDHTINIEVGCQCNYDGKNDSKLPKEQYDALIKLVRALMAAYNIPVGNIEFDSINTGNYPSQNASQGPIRAETQGIFGHYQLTPIGPDLRTDPGQGFLRDIREDLKLLGPDGSTASGSGTLTGGNSTDTSCVITKVGNPSEPPPPLPAACTSGGSSTPGGGGLPGQPLPSQDAAEVSKIMCEQYSVCPTGSDSSWTIRELTALWNVVQRIATSTKYKSVVAPTGGPVIEMQRISHCPNCKSWVEGLQAGVGSGGSKIDGSSLIYITNNAANPNYSTTYLEWLYSHEIGHIAQFIATDAFNAVSNCGQKISAYGLENGDGENFADAVSYYMTNGEQATDYKGSSGNLKNDFACIYNALNPMLFGGVQY